MKKLMIDDETYEMIHEYANKLTKILGHGVSFNQAIRLALHNNRYKLIYRTGEKWRYTTFSTIETISKFISNPQIEEFHILEDETNEQNEKPPRN